MGNEAPIEHCAGISNQF